MKKIFQLAPFNTDFAALLLRLIFGGLFIYHGYDKIDHYQLYLSMSKDIIGIGTKLSFDLVIFAEFVCGILVTLGFLTRLTVIPIMIAMSVAYFVAHEKDAFMMKELPFTFWLLSSLVFVMGSGKFSIDGLIFRKKQPY